MYNDDAVAELKRMEQPWRDLGVDANFDHSPTINCINPEHEDSTGSMQIFRGSDGSICYKCYSGACGVKGTIIDAYILKGLASDARDAIQKLKSIYLPGGVTTRTYAPRPRPRKPARRKPKPTTMRAPHFTAVVGKNDTPRSSIFDKKYNVTLSFKDTTTVDVVNMEYDELGHRALAVCRWDIPGKGKVVRQTWYDGEHWRLGRPKTVVLPLYNLDEIHDKPNAAVIIVEGEKALRALEPHARRFGYVPTTWIGGSNGMGSSDFSPIAGRQCIIWHDNDVAGENAAHTIAEIIGDGARLLNPFVDMGEQYEKFDAHEWFEELGKTLPDALEVGLSSPPGARSFDEIIADCNTIEDMLMEGAYEFAEAYPDATRAQTEVFLNACLAKFPGKKASLKAAIVGHKETIYNDLEVKPKAADHIAAEAAIADMGGSLVCYNGIYARYDGRMWRKTFAEEVKRYAHAAAAELIPHDEKRVARFQRDTLDVMTAMSGRGTDPFAKPIRNVINCNNGELHLTKGGWELRRHEPESFLSSCLPIDYDPKATCPTYDRAVLEIFSGNEEMATYWNTLVGYWASRPRRKDMWFLMLGGGSNGKSALMEFLVHNVLGADSTWQGRLQDLSTDFGPVNLQGKLIAYDDDLDQDYKMRDGDLKKFSGDKMIGSRVKHAKLDISFESTAAIVMSSNTPPKSRDNTYGMFRRACVIPFLRSFSPEERDETLFQRIAANEASGVLNRVIEGSMRDVSQMPDVVRRANVDWFCQSNIYARFYRHSECDPNLTSEGYLDFRDYCREVNEQARYISENQYLYEMQTLRRSIGDLPLKYADQ